HIELDPAADAGLIGTLLFTSTTLLFAVFLSFLAIREKSIWGACAWHAAWNWMFITWFGLPTTGIELNLAPLLGDLMAAPGAADWLTGGAEGPEGSVFTSIVLVAGCLLLWLRKARPGTVNASR
ncbi:MAG: CPBP family glutamic-type intramembrane protease, partial [Woeseia sp.]